MKALLAILALALCSCDTYYKDAEKTFYASLGTDSDAVVIDGPVPEMKGVVPVYDKKGRIVGQRPVYGGTPAGTNVGFARLGGNQSNTATRFLAEARNTALGWIAGEVTKAADANAAANEARKIDANAATEQTRLANEAARDAQRHAENMAEFETLAAPAP